MCRQIRKSEFAFWSWRWGVRVWRWWVENVVHPLLCIVTAITTRRLFLIDAPRHARWAGKSHMEMVMVSVPWPDLAQIAPVSGFSVAHCNLCTREDKNPRHPWIAGGSFDDVVMCLRPLVVDKGSIGPPHRNGRNVFAVRAAQVQPVGWAHPDVGIKADLVAGMAGEHRSPTWLADVAYVDTVPTGFAGCDARQVLQEVYRHWQTPIAVPRQTHRLPGRPSFSQLHLPGRTALCIASISCRRLGGCGIDPTEKLFRLSCAQDTACKRRVCRCRFITAWPAVASAGAKQEGESQDKRKPFHDTALFPFGLTQSNNTRPIRKSPITGLTPNCCDPVA